MSDAPPVMTYDPSEDGPLTPPGKAAVRPRDAATLILLDRRGGAPRVLMGRRSRGHDFMPDKWVFPGGRVDRVDFSAAAATELRPDEAERLARTAPRRAGLPRALALAAVRETFEETGLLLARPAPARPGVGGWRSFYAEGAAADLAALAFFARAVTPPNRPKRFDARFFTADAAALMPGGRSGSGELDEIDWIPLPDTHALDLPRVTRFILTELEARLADPSRPPLSLAMRHGKPTTRTL